MFKRSLEEESELTLAVRELRDELRAMREVLSELAEATQWQNNNAEDYPALVHERAALWAFAESRLPRLLEEIELGPNISLPANEPSEPKIQQGLF